MDLTTLTDADLHDLSAHTGPATVTLTVGNTSPWEDEANLTRFTGIVTALTVSSDQIPTISGGS